MPQKKQCFPPPCPAQLAIAAPGPPILRETPQALHTLSLRGPSPLLEVLLLKLSRFTGLLCLFLLNERQTLWSGAAGESDRALLPALLQHVPPRLQVLSASGFAGVRLETGSAGAGQPAAAAAQRSGSGAEPTQLLPRLEQLFITSCRDVVLDVPLPRLTELSVGNCDGTSLAGEQLHLPQLISLQLLSSGHWVRPGTSELARLRCGAMPLLSRLVCQYRVEASDSFAALQHLTHLELALVEGRPDSAKAVVGALPPTVCSLSITVRPDIQAVWSRFGGFGTAYGGVLCTYLAAIVPQITRLVGLRCATGACWLLSEMLSMAVRLHRSFCRPAVGILSMLVQACLHLFKKPPAVHAAATGLALSKLLPETSRCSRLAPPALTRPVALPPSACRRSMTQHAWRTCPPGRTCKSWCSATWTQLTSLRIESHSLKRQPACAAWPLRTALPGRATLGTCAALKRNAWRCAGRFAHGRSMVLCSCRSIQGMHMQRLFSWGPKVKRCGVPVADSSCSMCTLACRTCGRSCPTAQWSSIEDRASRMHSEPKRHQLVAPSLHLMGE